MPSSSEMSTSNQYVKYHISLYENSYNVTTNTSNVTIHVYFWRTNTGYSTYGTGTVYCKINGTTYSAAVTSSQKITNAGINLFAKTMDIPHNSDGTMTLTASAWINHNAPLTSNEQSYSIQLTTIPRKSEMTVANGTLGTVQTLTVNQKSSSFTHTITYSCGSYSGTICTQSSSTSISFTPGMELANTAPSGDTVAISYTIETFNGSSSVGSNTYRATCSIPDDVKPTLSIAVTDAGIDSDHNDSYKNLYGDYVKGYSRFGVTLTAAGAYGSTITSYETTADGSNYTSESFTTSVLRNVGAQTIQSTVTDSRGRKTTASIQVTVLDYSAPKIIGLEVTRCDADGTGDAGGAYLKASCTVSVAEVNNLNTYTCCIQYKKTTESAYTTVELTAFSGSYIFEADKYSSYDILFSVQDCFTASKASIIGASVEKFISLMKKGTGIALGKVADTTNSFDVNMDSHFRKKLYDKHGTEIRNGVAAYDEANELDPDTSLETIFLASTNTPVSAWSVGTWCIVQQFDGEKSVSGSRTQIAFPHATELLVNQLTPTYTRRYSETDNAWTDWHSDALKMWPVNSIYISYSHTSPAELFGGTWVRIDNAFLYGCGADDTIGETGGEKEHTLTQSEMPSHSHSYYSPIVQQVQSTSSGTTYGNYNKSYQIATNSMGGDQAHNNMPPYIQVSIWRRTA